MKLFRFSLFLIAIITLIAGCTERIADPKLNLLNNDLKRHYQLSSDKSIKQIIFISDEGCPNCVVSFSNYILNNIDKYQDSTLILINSKGYNVDLDRFAALNMKNIIISRTSRGLDADIIPELGVIYLNQCMEVDTILSIDASSIGNQLKYISNK